jgi:hypothetical protein
MGDRHPPQPDELKFLIEPLLSDILPHLPNFPTSGGRLEIPHQERFVELSSEIDVVEGAEDGPAGAVTAETRPLEEGLGDSPGPPSGPAPAPRRYPKMSMGLISIALAAIRDQDSFLRIHMAGRATRDVLTVAGCGRGYYCSRLSKSLTISANTRTLTRLAGDATFTALLAERKYWDPKPRHLKPSLPTGAFLESGHCLSAQMIRF